MISFDFQFSTRKIGEIDFHAIWPYYIAFSDLIKSVNTVNLTAEVLSLLEPVNISSCSFCLFRCGKSYFKMTIEPLLTKIGWENAAKKYVVDDFQVKL